MNYEDHGSCILKGNCTTYYARKRGRSHTYNNTVCQDYCSVENIDDETQVVCVADGHGGEDYTRSDKGSYYACSVFTQLVKHVKDCYNKTNYDERWFEILKTADFKKQFIKTWKQTVIQDYKNENPETDKTDYEMIKKYGTTFLFVVYTADFYIIGQLGDGAILLSNDDHQNQLFQRRGIKTSSTTNSLASSRAEYGFAIDLFETNFFSRVLLSTDGIYDKLDRGETFSLYEQGIVSQIEETGELKEPFTLNAIDVSEFSTDDCTIAILNSEKNTSTINLDKILESNIEDIKFSRHVNGLTIYEGLSNSKKVEIHIVKDALDETETDINSFKLIKAKQIMKSDDFYTYTAYIYEIPNTSFRISELIESEEHLEKKYFFNNNDSDLDEAYSNEYWLEVFQKLLILQNELNENQIFLSEYLTECLFITAEQEIVLLSDAILAQESDGIEKLFSRFSIIGSLTCGNTTIPLFKTTTQGQTIIELHTLPNLEKKVLCKIIYNSTINILGIWNLSEFTWQTEDAQKKEIPPNSVLRLHKNHTFYIEGSSKKYQVNIFRG
ncbi:MAG: PP2C family serine/threonine-protein phosphatase [Clostridia bacterium]